MQGDHLVYGICEAIEGEKDPHCLMHAFHIVEVVAQTFPDPAGPVASFAEDLFDIIGRYFPIHYTHVSFTNRAHRPSLLMSCFSTCQLF